MNNMFVKAALAMAFASTLALAVNVSSVQARQRWPWSGKVDIYYTLEAWDSEATFNIGFDCKDGDTPVTMKAYSGDGADGTTTGTGTKVLTWDASIDYPGKLTSDLTFGITATEAVPVEYLNYMKVNLTTGQVTFQSDSPSEWTAADKSDYLWLRKITPGYFMMGSGNAEVQRSPVGEDQHLVGLSKTYYIGVFPLTRDQYNNIDTNGVYHEYFTAPYGVDGAYPANNCSYEDLRGSSAGATWPTYTDHRVDENSFLGLLRAKCYHEYDFDLPTEAQWEYACRGTMGINGYWNDGSPVQNIDTDTNLVNLAWYNFNAEGESHEVGLKNPNGFGLRDMHGNVQEWCLDWYQTDISGLGNDPVGPASGTSRVLRGGSWGGMARYCRSASRGYYSPETRFNAYGARIALTLE